MQAEGRKKKNNNKMAVSRTKFAYINVGCSVIASILKMLLMFFVQQQLVKYLGYDLVGVNRTCTSIIGMLSVVEMGFGSAITFCLYEPLAHGNKRKIAALISLYRKIYYGIAIVVLIGVAVTMPFIKDFTQSNYDLGYLCLVYGLFALNTVATYLLSYNHTLLVADQHEFVATITTSVATSLMYVVQFVVLYCIKFFEDKAREFFVIYLIAAILFTFGGNLVIYILARKRYPYLREFKKAKLEKEDKSLIKKKVGALIYHRVGNYLVTGTDTLIITGFLTSAVSGITSNYYTITTALNSILSKVPHALLPGFGNLIVEADGQKTYSVYKRAQFPIFLLFVIGGIGATVLSDLFISRIWLSEAGLMDHAFTILLGTNFFITGYTSLMGNVRFAAGVFEPDKYLHIVIAVLNLVISILLVNVWGAAGVLVGTLICLIIKESSVLPYICCKYIFKMPLKRLLLRLWLEYGLYAVLCVACWFICGTFTMDNALVEFILKGLICVFLPAAVICLIYCRTDEMRYFIRKIKALATKIMRKIKGKDVARQGARSSEISPRDSADEELQTNNNTETNTENSKEDI